MKTLIQKAVIGLAWVMVAQQALAQNSNSMSARRSTFEIVPNIGVNSFHLTNSDLGLSNRGGMSAGAMANMATPIDGLSVEGGLDYFEAGGKASNIFASSEIELGYLAIPLRAKYDFYETGGYSFYGKAGATTAFLMSAKEKVSVFGESAEADIKDQANKMDLLGVVALGGSTEALGGRVDLEFEYDKGTQKTFKDRGEQLEGYVLRIGYAISL